MKVLEKMKELQEKNIIIVWIRDNITKYEYIYNTKGYSSIENPAYIELYKEIFNKKVLTCEYIKCSNNRYEARITYEM